MKEVFLFLFCFMQIFGVCLASDPTEKDSKTLYFQTVPNKTAAYDILEDLLAVEACESPILPDKLSEGLANIFLHFSDSLQAKCESLALSLHKAKGDFETQAGILDRITSRKPQ